MPAFAARGVRVLGVSTQTPAEQREAAERLGLPYALLSDADGALERALDLPAFEVDGLRMLRRLTLLLRDGVIEDAIYPVFPPDDAARAALERLRGT